MSIESETKRWAHDMWLHNTAVTQEIQRAATAIGYGLNPEQFTRPFPGSNTNVTIHQAPQQKSGIGKLLAGSLLAAALGAGGAAGAVALMNRGGAPAVCPILEPQKFRVDWRVNDGKSESKVTPIQ